MDAVTRIEIADLIGNAFGPAGADRASLLATATSNGANPRVLDALGRLPDRRFATMRHLWEHLPELPVG